MSKPALSAVIPVRNELGNVALVLFELQQALRPFEPFEIVVVDDGSSDGTAAALAGARRQFPQLVVLRHRKSCGQSAAIRTGVEAARGEWIVTLDGDGQNDPADIALLLKARDGELQRGGGDARIMICGQRRGRRDTAWKKLSSRIANAVRGAMLGDRIQDTGCSLKLFRREDFLAMPGFDHMHRFLPALMLRQGGRVAAVDVGHRARMSGASNYGTLDRLFVGIADLLGVMWLMRRVSRPELEELPPAGASGVDSSRETERA